MVVLVGHIDHGKSSILESIKQFGVLDKESGGITQHISTYEVEREDETFTFIDTPGHAAFVSMRARGSEIADLAVLVVAVDEGVMPQTEEAIRHLKESDTPFVVALNKMDKPEAHPNKVRKQLSEVGVVVEENGGEVPSIEVSAETGQGIEDLLEVLSLLNDMREEEVKREGPASGVVIESNVSSKRGSVVTLLVKEGILREGDIVGTSTTFGRVRRAEDFLGERIEEMKPGQAASILGFKDLPRVGERFEVFSDLEEARDYLEQKEREGEVKIGGEGKAKKTMNIILKTDVAGSLEPVEKVLAELPQEKVCLNLVQSGVGDVSRNDLKMAETCQAVIIGFRVDVPEREREEAEKIGVRIFTFDIIYELREGLIKIMKSYLGPQKVRVNLAKLETLVIFKNDRRRQVVGARVKKGEVKKGNKIEVFRPDDSGEVELKPGEGIGEGRVVGLQENKKEIKKGTEGSEVGILYEGKGEEIEEEDILVAFEIREKMLDLD